MTTRLIQISNGITRKVGLVDEPHIRLLSNYATIYELAKAAISAHIPLRELINSHVTDEKLDYDELYALRSDWNILPSADHPDDPAHCHVSGTGLTHTAGAKNRNAMHATGDNLTDSMRVFLWGIEKGKPAAGQIGVAPEWFYKGCGDVLRGHGEPLVVPSYGEDGGEEPEVAGVYLIADNGQPYRIGLTIGNEFSDHKFEKQNYLYLAGSKLRTCAIGPELVIDHEFKSVPGTVSVERDGATLWSSPVTTGENEMCHSLQNIEHHHFKFEGHRRPGDLHVHYYGADAFSFGAGIHLEDGDLMKVSFEGFGRPLQNPVKVEKEEDRLVSVATV